TLCLGNDEAFTEENVAIGTENGVNECEFAASVDYGCGDVWIGNEDMAKLMVLLLNKGSYLGEEVLQNDLFNEMTRPHFSKGRGLNYGLGLDIYSGFTPMILGHGGGSLGYASTFYWIPEYDFGVSVQTNMEWYSSAKKNPHSLGTDARESLLKVNGATLARTQPDELLQEPASGPIIDDLSRLAGFYAGLWNSTVSVDYRDGKLYWHSNAEMTPEGNGFRLKSGNAVKFNFKRKNSKYPDSITYVNPRYPAAELTVERVEPVKPNPSAPRISNDLAEQMTGIYKATYYGSEPTFNVAKVEDGQLLVSSMVGMVPAYPHKSIEGLFFVGKGEAVTFEGNELWIENVRGVKWEDPVEELEQLIKSDPGHRLLRKFTLGQIASHLKTLGRRKEAKEVSALRKALYDKKNE
ncbi:MAG: serine hydrolase, partial [Candidatus Hodarchaeota archaeon]